MQDRPQIGVLDAGDRDVAARDGGEADEGGDLDVVGADAVVAARQPLDAVDVQHVRADALDARAHLTSIRHRSCTCGSQAVLIRQVRPGASTAAMTAFSVPVTLGSSRNTSVPFRPAGAVMSMERSTIDLGAERLERQDVRVDAAAADHVAARRRHVAAAAREQRAGEQDRRADAAAERRSSVVFETNSARISGRSAAVHSTLGAEIGDQLEHHLDVADARHVGQPDGAVGQQRRSDDGQRRVLVALGGDGPGEGTSALDDEVLASQRACRGLDRGHGRPCYQPLLPYHPPDDRSRP